jgi:hypothetical protein
VHDARWIERARRRAAIRVDHAPELVPRIRADPDSGGDHDRLLAPEDLHMHPVPAGERTRLAARRRRPGGRPELRPGTDRRGKQPLLVRHPSIDPRGRVVAATAGAQSEGEEAGGDRVHAHAGIVAPTAARVWWCRAEGVWGGAGVVVPRGGVWAARVWSCRAEGASGRSGATGRGAAPTARTRRVSGS